MHPRAGHQALACLPRLSYRQGTTRPVRLAVRTSASHVENRGSIPLRGAKLLLFINKLTSGEALPGIEPPPKTGVLRGEQRPLNAPRHHVQARPSAKWLDYGRRA